MTGYVRKPLPEITDENRPFWDGCLAGELRMQRCVADGHIRFPIQPLCPQCLSPDFTWQALSGSGEVFARIVYHRAFHPAYAADVPYNVVLVQLAEGPRMYSNVVGCSDEDIRVGDPLAVAFRAVADGIAVPCFRLRDADER